MPKFIFAINAYQNFAKRLSKKAKIKLGKRVIEKFSNGEIYTRVKEKVAGQDVFVVGTVAPPSDNLIEFLLLSQALSLAKAKNITAIIPFLGYERADRMVEAGEAVSAKLVADLLEFLHFKKIIAVDLHSYRVVEFIKKHTKLIHLSAIEILAEAVENKKLKNIAVVAPDNGALPNAQRLARILKCGVAWMEKFRPRHNVACIRKLHGEVKNKCAILIDDMIDTGGTICEAAACLEEAGAKKIIVVATHGIFSGPALAYLHQAPIESIFITDTIDLSADKKTQKIKAVSIIDLLSNAISKL